MLIKRVNSVFYTNNSVFYQIFALCISLSLQRELEAANKRVEEAQVKVDNARK